MVRGARVGFETVAVTSSAGGYDISSAGRQIAPVDLVVTKFNVVYTPDWQPQRLTIEGVLKGQIISLGASFGLTTVNVDVMQAGHYSACAATAVPPVPALAAFALVGALVQSRAESSAYGR